MDLGEYLRVLRKRWRLITFVFLLVVAAGATMVASAVPKYQSTTTFFISTPATATGDTSSAYTGGLFSQQRVKSYAELLSQEDLAELVRADLGLNVKASELAGEITAQVKPDTVLLVAAVTDPSPRRARDVASSLARQFPLLVSRLESSESGGAASIRAIVVQVPKDPRQVSPRPVRTVGIATVVGLLLGLGMALVREMLDNSIRTPEEVQATADLATLGSIGYHSRIAKHPLVLNGSLTSGSPPHAEAFRQLRTNLQFVSIEEGLRSVVITSSLPNEGKSTSACNLAITLAQSGARVLLFEGDLRRPKIPDYLGVEGAVGVTDILLGRLGVADAIQRWGDIGLDVLASGPLPPNPAELLGSVGMLNLLKGLEDDYDIVVVDAPPLLPVTDAAVLAAMTSGALLCVRSGKTHRDQLARAAQSLEAVGARTLGVLLTMVPQRGLSGGSGYGYAYGYEVVEKDIPQERFRTGPGPLR